MAFFLGHRYPLLDFGLWVFEFIAAMGTLPSSKWGSKCLICGVSLCNLISYQHLFFNFVVALLLQSSSSMAFFLGHCFPLLDLCLWVFESIAAMGAYLLQNGV
jgi:hypothetical protein